MPGGEGRSLGALQWVGSSLEDLRSFPADARREAGHQLHRVQCGLHPTDWRPMPSVGPGVREIRLSTGREHRVLYVVARSKTVFVLHAFEKKSRKTMQRDLETGRRRLAAIVRRRGDDHG